MDELLSALLNVQTSLEEFDNLLYGATKSLQQEVDQLRKELAPANDITALDNDIKTLETFHAVTASQMREYLQEKINLLKVYLYED